MGGFLLLLGLGTWQIERLGWKESLIAERQAAASAPPIDIPPVPNPAHALEFRRVKATGVFLNDHELYLHAIAEDGQVGYHVITPLRLAGGSILLVDRGFVPEDRKAPQSRSAGELKGDAAVTGFLRRPPAGKPGWFVPDNGAARNEWFFVDIPAMTSAARLEGVLPFYVEADQSPNPGGLPTGGQTRLELPNNHLQYALTWYALAAGFAVIYIRVIRRRLAEEGRSE
jgi:surfeit locus 1 family protein